MAIDTVVKALVENFRGQSEAYLSPAYNETQLRRDFLDKVIKALGWDVDNEQASSETFREVVHEDRLAIDGQSKAPNYCVQLGGRKLFYIEAKKPAVNISADAAPAYQVRRYGWTAKMPVCLLSSFAEFAVYDTTVKPSPKDDAAAARIFYCRYDELETVNPKYGQGAPCPNGLTNWEYLYNLFSQEAVRKGSLERIAAAANKKGTQTVDEAFLEEIENWRGALAVNLALRNAGLSERLVNFAVQKTIDRIIFLRIAEDRGIESKHILKTIAGGKEVYKHLLNVFIAADEKYNSGLFHFHTEKNITEEPDTLTPSLVIDDKILKDIINTLYYPAPYEFAALPADILGSIYERFLGKVIRLTAGHRARVEEKPEVRKAGGVYYTPSYIVDYIVVHTIGEALKDKTPKTISAFRVLDPACGSGSFLISAYQFLLDWYLGEYIGMRGEGSGGSEILTPRPSPLSPIIKTGENSYKLSIRERKRILTAHIFGVDIDTQAVEVTKLSLLLKAMEGLSQQEIQKSLFHERILPDLGGNIKCGNSLIGSDFYAQGTLGFTEEEQYKINAFDWEIEFPEIFTTKAKKAQKEEEKDADKNPCAPYAPSRLNNDSGFDVVIGNPPYVQITAQQDYTQKYLQEHYTAALDLYSLFIEKGLSLLKPENTLGFIVPSLFLKGVIYEKLRMLINSACKNAAIKEYGDGVFHGVKMPTCIILLSKGENRKARDFFENKNARIFNKKETVKLGAIASITRGLEIGRDRLLEAGDFVCLTGGSIDVYAVKEKRYISKNTKKQFSKNDEVFQSPKIMVRETGDRFFAAIDYDNVLTTRSIYNTKIGMLVLSRNTFWA